MPVCVGSFSATLPASVPVWRSLSATARVGEYNTSEFSICRGIYPPLPLVIEHSGTDVIIPAGVLVGWVLQSSPNVLPPVWTDDHTHVV